MSNRTARALKNLQARRKAFDTMLSSNRTSQRTRDMHKRPGSVNPRKGA